MKKYTPVTLTSDTAGGFNSIPNVNTSIGVCDMLIGTIISGELRAEMSMTIPQDDKAHMIVRCIMENIISGEMWRWGNVTLPVNAHVKMTITADGHMEVYTK